LEREGELKEGAGESKFFEFSRLIDVSKKNTSSSFRVLMNSHPLITRGNQRKIQIGPNAREIEARKRRDHEGKGGHRLKTPGFNVVVCGDGIARFVLSLSLSF
jgi:hypothetical protein